MSILKPDINAGMRLFAETAGAVLLDVRTREEYADGHIYGSVNIPIGTITDFPRRYADRSTPVFIYCRSGVRSGRAASYLRSRGYKNAVGIGGIEDYEGEISLQ